MVPDFRLNKAFDQLKGLPQAQKDKVEFLCNECCWPGCKDRKLRYETVSRKNLGEACPEHVCTAPDAQEGYRFSKAMQSPMAFIGTEEIRRTYLPMGFSHFKIEGRGLGSAPILISAVLHDKAGISAAGAGSNLSGQYAGFVLEQKRRKKICAAAFLQCSDVL